MNVVRERCCGLDVHKATVVACRLTPGRKEVQTFPTTTRGLLALADWLAEAEITDVAMESTGVYWKPIFNVLKLTDLDVIVVKAHHIKAVPGRKTDVKDAEWIADLLKHGLLKASSIPTEAIASCGSWFAIGSRSPSSATTWSIASRSCWKAPM